MNRAEVLDLIVTTLQNLLESDSDSETSIHFDERTRLYGSEGLLDSLRLVTLVLDLEQEINDHMGTSITITDSRAMSQERSPFRMVGSLADYILDRLQDEQRAVGL